MEKIAYQIHNLLKAIVEYMKHPINENLYSIDSIKDNLECIRNINSRPYYNLKDEFEFEYFLQLFSYNIPTSFYHYTSFNAIYEIIKSGKIQLSSITGLNDKYESNLINQKMGMNSGHLMTTLNANLHYIMSFSTKNDNLNQWRLYGEDGEGVMLEFTLNNPTQHSRKCFIAKVQYDLGIFDIIIAHRKTFNERCNFSFGLKTIDYWKFFFKYEDYLDEGELRLLIKNVNSKFHEANPNFYRINRYNILTPYIEYDMNTKTEQDCFPFELKSILLGPKMREQQINRIQLENFWHDKYPKDPKVYTVNKSQILHYR